MPNSTVRRNLLSCLIIKEMIFASLISLPLTLRTTRHINATIYIYAKLFGKRQLFHSILIKEKETGRPYMIAMKSRIFRGSTLEDLWCLGRPSETSSASFLSGGAVTGRVGNAFDQKGSRALRNLWRKGPAFQTILLITSMSKETLLSYKVQKQKHHEWKKYIKQTWTNVAKQVL